MILRLLVVDDDPMLCKSMKDFFERDDYRVEIAHDGPAALDKVRSFRPHLMFLDIGLPGLSGIEVLKKTKEVDSSVRVIMITGQSEEELIRQSRVLGADDYVVKPFRLEYLNGEVMSKLQKFLFYELRSMAVTLEAEQEKHMLVFNQMQDGVVFFDMGGFAVHANPAAAKWLRLPEGALHVKIADLFKNFDRMRESADKEESPEGQPLDKPLRNIEDYLGRSIDLIRESRGSLVLQCRISVQPSRDKQKSGYMALLRNVTWDRKGHNTMTRFIALMDHKLRTPLVPLKVLPTYMFTFEDKIHPLSETQKKSWHIVQEQTDRLIDIVTESTVLAGFDKDLLSLEPLLPSDIVKDAVAQLREPAKSKASGIECRPLLERTWVDVDRKLIAQAFRHLIENAFKFGGTCLIIEEKTDEDSVLIRFSDNGPGIPPEEHEHLFERFHQVETGFCGQAPGAGLGLAIVKETVKIHGGKVWLEKADDHGSVFVIRLPLAASQRRDLPKAA